MLRKVHEAGRVADFTEMDIGLAGGRAADGPDPRQLRFALAMAVGLGPRDGARSRRTDLVH
jgi:hypothetical protein